MDLFMYVFGVIILLIIGINNNKIFNESLSIISDFLTFIPILKQNIKKLFLFPFRVRTCATRTW